MLDGNKGRRIYYDAHRYVFFGEDSGITPCRRVPLTRILRAIMEGTAKFICNDSDKCLKVVADANVTIARIKP